MSLLFRRTACAVAAIAATLSPLSASIVSAQDYPPPPQHDYPDSAPPRQDYPDAPPPRDDAPPPGYDGTRPPPPPPEYRADQDDAAQRAQDDRYEAYAEDWAERNCFKAHSNAGAGAVIGGLFGALLGSGLSGRHDHGSGALVGGLLGAGAGAAIGSTSSNDTSPGCPPGYVVRNDAPAFYYGGYDGPYYYAAPGWYRPWVFYEGRWNYRPYPYHAWYYTHYRYGGRGYGRPGGGYGGGYRHRHW